MRNESPIGLATILGLLPALGAIAVLIVLVIIYRGDVERATATLLTIIAAASTVGTAALRQWRATAGAGQPATRPNVEIDGIPSDPHEGAER